MEIHDQIKSQTEKMVYERRDCPTCGEVNWMYFGCSLDPLAPAPDVCVCFKCASPFWLVSEEIVDEHYRQQININYVVGRNRP